MNDVSVVEVSHEDQAYEGKDKREELLPVRVSLWTIKHRPYDVVDLEHDEEGRVRRGQVEDEPLLVCR